MPPEVPIDLENKIIATLTDPNTELWFPNLTYDLVQNGWHKLYQEIGISEENYSTARVTLKDTNAGSITKRSIFVCKNLEENTNEVFIEMLPASIVEQYKDSGVNFYTHEEIQENSELIRTVKDAFEMIKMVPDLFSTVNHLIKSIHLIKPEDDEYDVSFSEPNIPFSVFISVPRKYNLMNVLRLAETIVHEAMHLQLTLIEDFVLLVVSGKELIYSPWRDEYRTPNGVIHALYVFSVIYNFFQMLFQNDFLSIEYKDYINDRNKEISFQINKIADFQNCPDLTYSGKKFTQRLLSFHHNCNSARN